MKKIFSCCVILVGTLFCGQLFMIDAKAQYGRPSGPTRGPAPGAQTATQPVSPPFPTQPYGAPGKPPTQIQFIQPVPVAACCFTRNNRVICVLQPKAICENTLHGNYLSDYVCTDSPTLCDKGACCSATGCEVTVQKVCENEKKGTFLGKDTNCEGEPCTHKGACCTGDGCAVTFQKICSGTYLLGDNTTCDSNPCADKGACCNKVDNICSIKTQVECDNNNGVYAGNGVNCSSPTCNRIEPEHLGACCLPSGSCVSTFEDDCKKDFHGNFQSENSDCSQANCP